MGTLFRPKGVCACGLGRLAGRLRICGSGRFLGSLSDSVSILAPLGPPLLLDEVMIHGSAFLHPVQALHVRGHARPRSIAVRAASRCSAPAHEVRSRVEPSFDGPRRADEGSARPPAAAPTVPAVARAPSPSSAKAPVPASAAVAASAAPAAASAAVAKPSDASASASCCEAKLSMSCAAARSTSAARCPALCSRGSTSQRRPIRMVAKTSLPPTLVVTLHAPALLTLILTAMRIESEAKRLVRIILSNAALRQLQRGTRCTFVALAILVFSLPAPFSIRPPRLLSRRRGLQRSQVLHDVRASGQTSYFAVKGRRRTCRGQRLVLRHAPHRCGRARCTSRHDRLRGLNAALPHAASQCRGPGRVQPVVAQRAGRTAS